MDLGTVIGLVMVFTGIIGVHVGGALEVFPKPLFFGLMDLPAVAIIMLGVGGSLFIMYPMNVIFGLPKIGLKAVFHKPIDDPPAVVELFVRLAEKARREGLLSLEEEEEALTNPFMRKGIMLVVDGQDPDLIKGVLEIEMENIEKRHTSGRKVLETGGELAPAFGLMGTVMGLIQVLANLDKPDELGGKVSIAFVSTLWGIMLANTIFKPIAKKLEVRSKEEVGNYEIMLEGILAVQAGENPRIIKEKLEGFLTPAERARGVAEAEAAGAEAETA